MTIQEMASMFDLLQDKFQAPYFTDPEKSLYLHRAQLDFVTDVMAPLATSMSGGERGAVTTNSFESTIQGTEALEPLIVPDISVLTGASGVILKSTLRTALSNKINKPGSDYMYLLSLQKAHGGDYLPVRYIRHNDFYKIKQNVFKRPTEKHAVYRLVRDQILISPEQAGFLLRASVLKYPQEISIDDNVSCELPDWTHDDIIARALAFAGIASRDEALVALNAQVNPKNG